MTLTLHEEFEEISTIRPDRQGRVTLQRSMKKTAAPKVDAYKQYLGPHGEILLIPIAEIPLRELWVYQNPAVLESIERGLEQSANGQTTSLGSFAHFLEDEEETEA